MSQTRDQIKQNINDHITTNGAGEITGAVLRGVLNNMADNLGTEEEITDIITQIDTQVAEIDSRLDDAENKIADITASPICEGLADTISNGVAQEFVHRPSGGDGVNYLKRIKGKSLAWNQLIQNGNFANNSTTKWVLKRVAATFDSNVLTLTCNEAGEIGLIQANILTPSHKMLMVFKMKSSVNISIGLGGNYSFAIIPASDSFSTIKRIGAVGSSKNFELLHSGSSVGDTFSFDCNRGINIIDLTLLYGSDISGLTDAQILAKYEAEFGDKYYPNSNGELICNDAKYLETVGFNQWDEEWKVGKISLTTGEEEVATSRIINKNYIRILPSRQYYFKKMAGVLIYVFYYSQDGSFINYEDPFYTSGTGGIFTTPNAAYYMRFNANIGTYDGGVININLSDPAKNGTYEPFWKRRLPVNCDSFKVKSHNIWDEEWESGTIDYNTGENDSASNAIRAKNYIPIFPNTEYYFKSPLNGAIYYYDANKNYLGVDYYGSLTANSTFTTPVSAYYMRFRLLATTYNNDICINLSGPFNDQYEPHGEITVNGLYGRGTSFDEKTAVKYYKRRARVNLGDVQKSKFHKGDYSFYLDGDAINNFKKLGQIICSKYEVVFPGTTGVNMPDKTVASQNSYCIYIKDTAYSNLDDFFAAMNGVYLDYELATPIEYELVEPCFPAIMVDELGTEQAIYPTHADGSPSAAFCSDSNYSISIKNLVNFINNQNS